METASDFVNVLAKLSFPNVFNPYSEICTLYDHANSPSKRKENLERVLDFALNSKIESMWVARDLGFRGGRRTGLALTDEAHLSAHSLMMGDVSLNQATKGPLVAERTASVIWNVAAQIKQPLFLWNVFPLHPFLSNRPMTNRSHTKEEARQTRFLLEWLIARLKPTKIIAIGRDAQIALTELGFSTLAVRHPSYGGQAEFKVGMLNYYGVSLPKISCDEQPMLI